MGYYIQISEILWSMWKKQRRCIKLWVDQNINSNAIQYDKTLAAVVYEMNTNILSTKAYEKIFNRFLERLEISSTKIDIQCNDKIVCCRCLGMDEELSICFDFYRKKADILFVYNQSSKSRKEINIFENLILELFRTRKYRVGVL